MMKGTMHCMKELEMQRRMNSVDTRPRMGSTWR